MRYVFPAVTVFAFVAFMLLVLLTVAPPAKAQEGGPVVETEGPPSFFHSCPRNFTSLGFIVVIIGVTVAGSRSVGRSGRWPLWAPLARGLGDAGFLVAVAWLFAGLREGAVTIAQMGAAVTPADICDGLMRSAADLCMGSLVALLGLLGAGAIRLRESRAIAPRARSPGGS